MRCRAACAVCGGIMNSWAHGDHSASFGLLWAPGWKDFDLTPAFSQRGIAFECVPALSLAVRSRQRRGEQGRRRGAVYPHQEWSSGPSQYSLFFINLIISFFSLPIKFFLTVLRRASFASMRYVYFFLIGSFLDIVGLFEEWK